MIMPVRRAVEKAYPADGHDKLTQAQCVGALLARTPGVTGEFVKTELGQKIWEPKMRSYDELAEDLRASSGELRAVVKHGRSVIEFELASRGLIPVRN